MSSTARGPATGDEDTVAEIMRRGGVELRERMLRTEEHLERVAAEAGVPLAVHATSTVLAGGKRLRPLLVVLAATAAAGSDGPRDAAAGSDRQSDPAAGSDRQRDAESDGGVQAGPLDTEEGERSLVRAAVAVELVHSATLVHDDVIDGAQLRRGRPSVVAQAGRRAAIATGDLLFSRAFAELTRNADVAQLRALSDASSALAVGELLQREDAYAPRVAVERYLRRCELKTAALFEAACRLGALVARGSDRSAGALADALGAFARRIGLAFQLLDDVLDVSGPVERTGKTRGTDLLDGTVTLPLILARERDERLAAIDLGSLSTPEQADELCERIAATGALEEARERALTLVAEAKAMLPAILPNGNAALLDLVADAVVERYR
ncbi:MAG: polyprenyl synthetase family protein [Solirubrobacterales bacterium]